MMWLWISAALMAVTAVIHSVAGEKRLIGPALASNQGVLAVPFARKVMRAAWHLTSLFMLSNAVTMVWPNTPSGLHIAIGSFWLFTGAFSLITSRGKHVGWPTLSAAGITALIGASL